MAELLERGCLTAIGRIEQSRGSFLRFEDLLHALESSSAALDGRQVVALQVNHGKAKKRIAL